MQSLALLFFAVFSCVTLVGAADPSRDVVPICASVCASAALENQTACLNTDLVCLCGSNDFNSQTMACVRASCSVKERLVATRLSLAQCGVPVRDRDWSIIPLRTALLALATILVIIRYSNRALRFGGMRWWWDDWCIIPAYAMTVCYFSASVLMYNYGLGIDMWDLPFLNITSFLHATYYCALSYKIEMALAKIAVCLFFLRIFPTRTFYIYSWTVIVLNAIVGALFFFLDSFQCAPVSAAWRGWAAEEPATCIDWPSVIYANGFFNIALDVVMISLPIHEVFKLNLTLEKKLGAAAMFATGFILTIMGILRNVNYVKHMRTTNPTYELKTLHQWALCEVMISLICACLPDLRVFIMEISWILRGHPERTAYPTNRSYTKASIIVMKTFKTDYEVDGKHNDTESQTQLVHVPVPRPSWKPRTRMGAETS